MYIQIFIYKNINIYEYNNIYICIDIYIYTYTHTYIYTNAFRNNFPGFACWGDLILSEFQNQFCACSAQPGKKCESGSLFDTKMPALLRAGYFVIAGGTDKSYI